MSSHVTLNRGEPIQNRITDEQVVCILREAESKHESIRDACTRHNITEQNFFRWRNKFGGMDVAPWSEKRSLVNDYFQP